MKNSSPILVTIVLFALLVAFQQPSPSEANILETNLEAAIKLDAKFLATCGESPINFRNSGGSAPLLEGLGSHTFPISGADESSQRYFNQGLNLAYGFNHNEAYRSFKEASKLSEDASMPYWGQAYAIGPNINDPEIDLERRRTAYEMLAIAASKLEKATDLERKLIEALRSRYRKVADSILVDNEAYMTKMKSVAQQFPDHADVQTLYAAAIMNTMPWDYWSRKLEPRTNTIQARDALDRAIAINEAHPGAHHFRIHLMELPFPDKAAESGDALGPLMPGAGHMVHMPSHAYIRVGRYKDALESNQKAIIADEDYLSQCYSQGVYPLGYYPHNIHFLWSAATQMGHRETAIAAARKTAEKVSIGLLEGSASFQEFAAIPYQAYVRFGEWDALLTKPDPGSQYQHLKVYWHYGRALAFIAKGNLQEAEEELNTLQTMSEDESLSSLVLFAGNTTHQVAQIAYNIVGGELSAAKNEPEQAKTFFTTAIEAEDALSYSEPPAWHLSTRLNYGDFLVEMGQFEEATATFEEELNVWRNNGWALKGLYNALKGQGEMEKCDNVQRQLKESWKYADIEIKSAVL